MTTKLAVGICPAILCPMHWISLFLLLTPHEHPRKCVQHVNGVAPIASRLPFNVQAHPELGLSTLMFRGRKIDASNALPVPDDVPVNPIYVWNEKEQVGMIISQMAAPHGILRTMLPPNVQVIGGTRYVLESGQLLRINSMTFEDLPGEAMQDKYFELNVTKP